VDRQTETSLIRQVLGLAERNEAFLDEAVTQSVMTRYTSPARFAAEHAQLLRRVPMIAAAAASLAEPHAFITKTYLDLPILLVRGADGQARAFVNVCRHRGARVEAAEAGCKRVFTCPYHGWSWSSDGTLRHVPHAAQGFPDLNADSLGLAALPCVERHGFVWIIADPAVADAPDLDAWLGPLNADLTWLGLADHVSAASDTIEVAANWKLLMEGGGWKPITSASRTRRPLAPIFPTISPPMRQSGRICARCCHARASATCGRCPSGTGACAPWRMCSTRCSAPPSFWRSRIT
jgi:nitrite reductase/ring-hydroxylating ferredoxin subunit